MWPLYVYFDPRFFLKTAVTPRLFRPPSIQVQRVTTKLAISVFCKKLPSDYDLFNWVIFPLLNEVYKNRLIWPIPVQYFLLLFFKFLTSLISGDIFNFPVWQTNGTTLLNNFDGPNCYAQLSLLEYCFFDPWLCSVFLSNLNPQAYRRSRILQFLTKSHPDILNYYSLKSYTTGKPKTLPLEPD